MEKAKRLQVERWCVVKADGQFLDWTAKRTRREAINEIAGPMSWKGWRADGFTVRRVRVTIQELP